MTTFAKYARIYDVVGQDAFSRRLINALDQLPEQLTLGGQAVDLACGTGSAAILLAERGFDVTGVDKSHAMLLQAKKKLGRLETSMCLVQQDICQLGLDLKADLVTCLFNSLNFILDHSCFSAAIHDASQLLKPRGYLVFDTNTMQHYETVWDDRSWVRDRGEVFCTYITRYEPEDHLGEMKIVWFERSGHCYRRFEEVHYQRAYAPEEIADAIHNAGLSISATWDPFNMSAPARNSHAVIYIAQRRT